VAVVIVLLIVVLLALVVAVVGAPLRARARSELPAGQRPGAVEQPGADADGEEQALLAELHAAREAKYQEIRDAELDYRTGKLSREDFDAIDAALRAEAIEILDRLEAAQEGRREVGGEEITPT